MWLSSDRKSLHQIDNAVKDENTQPHKKGSTSKICHRYIQPNSFLLDLLSESTNQQLDMSEL